MANKQYVFSGAGSPIDNSVVPDALTSHYIDTDSGDIWLHNGMAWRCVFRGGSTVNLAFYDGTKGDYPPEDIDFVAMRYAGGNLSIHLSGTWMQIDIAPPS